MTIHDTWATLRPGNPLLEIMHLFPDEQVPMRDPFPMGLASRGTEKAALFTIDIHRLSPIQTNAIIAIYAEFLEVSDEEILHDALSKGGIAINSLYLERLFCGPEGYQRTQELADFYEKYPNPTIKQLDDFMKDQRNSWVEGYEQPRSMPTKFEDFDPRFQTDELEQALNEKEINEHFANYSVFDVLTGPAMVDFLNKQNPDMHYELTSLEELLEDD